MNKLNYILIPSVILLLIGNGVLYRKIAYLKEQDLNIEKENLELKNKLAKNGVIVTSLNDIDIFKNFWRNKKFLSAELEELRSQYLYLLRLEQVLIPNPDFR